MYLHVPPNGTENVLTLEPRRCTSDVAEGHNVIADRLRGATTSGQASAYAY